MEGIGDSINIVTNALQSERVVYAVTGSIASSIHGEPLTSLDVGIVVRMTPEQAAGLAKRLGARFYADVDMLRKAAVENSMANLLDQENGLKFDISVLDDTLYHRQVLQRRVEMPLPGFNRTFWVVTPEDIILMKLIWRRKTQSQKQWDNALGVVRVKGNTLDWAYLRDWAGQLDVERDLDALAREAGI